MVDKRLQVEFKIVFVHFSANFVCDTSHLMSGVKKLRCKSITSADDIVNTSPAKWPGNIPSGECERVQSAKCY